MVEYTIKLTSIFTTIFKVHLSMEKKFLMLVNHIHDAEIYPFNFHWTVTSWFKNVSCIVQTRILFRCSVRILVGTIAILTEAFHCFLRPYRQIPAQNLTQSIFHDHFQILCSSSFTSHPTIDTMWTETLPAFPIINK